jgi:hypothetical protein
LLDRAQHSSGALDSAHLDADHNTSCPLRLRTLDNIIGDAEVPGLAARELDYGELMLAAGEEPTMFTDAGQHAPWRGAMLEEMAAIERNKAWRLTNLPPGHRSIGLKWVYKLKKDAQGNVVKHKARLVAKGYV